MTTTPTKTPTKNVNDNAHASGSSSRSKFDEAKDEDEVESMLTASQLFYLIFAIIQALNIACLALIIYYCIQWSSSSSSRTIKWLHFHPPLLTTGMIAINANAILIYRSTRTLRYRTQMAAHWSLQAAMIVVSWIGFYAAFASRSSSSSFASASALSTNQSHRPRSKHFYSLHSWLGLAALIGATVSLVASFITFAYPRASSIYRRLALPFHVFGGVTNLALAAVICISGAVECSARKAKRSNMVILINAYGLTIVTIVMLTIWLVTDSRFKRRYPKMLDIANQCAIKRQKTIN